MRAAKALVLTCAAGLVLGGMVGTHAAGRVGLSDVTWEADAASTAEVLVARHGCWQGAAPADQAGKLPGHVVVSPAVGAEAVYSADLVGEALGHVFETPRPGMTVYAFCR